MSAKHRGILILLLVLAASLPGKAHVVPMSLPELAAASPDVVIATVEGKQSRWNESHTFIVTDYTLRIEDRLRGEAPDRISITVLGGTVGRERDDTCVSVHLEPGSRYLLFLDDPGSLSPVTGAAQGAFREVPGGGFRDLVGAMRKLVARTALAPRSEAPADPGLPAKRWDPAATATVLVSRPPLAAPEPQLPAEPATEEVETFAGRLTPPRAVPGKYLYPGTQKRPIVVNPLTDPPFSPWDQEEMAYWNRYAGDLFRVSASPTSTWAFHNDVSDIAGFPGDATLMQQFGKTWSPGVLATTFTHWVDDVLIEADVAFNPHVGWSLDEVEATSNASSAYDFKQAVLHELGHVWGLWHPWDGGAQVTWDSVMNYKDRAYLLPELFADDTMAVRHAFPPGISLRDGLISSYVTVQDGLAPYPDYRTPFPTAPSLSAGGGFGLAGPIKIENVGTVTLANPQVEVYLVPERFSLDGAVLIKRAKVRGRIPPGGTLQVVLSGFKVPRTAPSGDYYLAYVLRDPKDAYQGNNVAWSRDGFRVTVFGR
jgi:hypothetical protein